MNALAQALNTFRSVVANRNAAADRIRRTRDIPRAYANGRLVMVKRPAEVIYLGSTKLAW